jgi:hypothetical protein
MMADVLIIPSDEFRRQAKRLAKKYKSLAGDLTVLQQMLYENPFSGTDLGGGKRKIRLHVNSKGKGKARWNACHHISCCEVGGVGASVFDNLVR